MVASGIFLVLAAAVLAIAPLPLAYRSAGILLAAYLAFAVAGMPWAYLAALLAPPIGLLGGDADWLVMLPLIMSGNLLGMLGLEYAWRLPALFVSPLLALLPHLVTWALAQRELFAVALPWEPTDVAWLLLHGLVAVGGMLIALLVRRDVSPAGEADAQGW